MATRMLSLGTVPDALAVCGSPRSGTTWVAATLAAMPGSAILFEPLHLGEVPSAARAGFRWRSYQEPGTPWPHGEAFLRDVLRGRTLNRWTAQEIARPTRVGTWIVKFVRANRLLPWMTTRIDMRDPLVVLRHPCAVVASQAERGWPASPGEPDREHPFGEDVTAYVASLGTPEERLAATWALDTLVPLRAPTPWRWTVLPFERLATDGEAALRPVFDAWGLSMPQAVGERIGRWSSTTGARRPDEPSPVEAWRHRLSAGEVGRILAVTHRLGARMYGDDPTPLDDMTVTPPEV